MRRLRATLIALALTLPTAARAESAPFAFPDTDPGRHAAAWFEAYGAGTDDAMRAFWNAHGSPAALAQRPVEPRLQVARQVHGEQGALTPLSVATSREDFCEIVARNAHGETIRIGFMCERDAPHGLVSLRLLDDPQGGGGPPPPGAVILGGPAGGPGGVAAAPAPPPAETGPPPTDAQIVATLSAQVDSLARIGAFSGAVLLDKDGATRYQRAVGLASAAHHAPNTVQTAFNLGSINKIFTHVAIEQLAQAGTLSLDDPVTRWLPDYQVVGGERITLRMLLEHKGGVPDVFRSPDLAGDPKRVRTMADWYAAVRGMALDFEPGTRQQYSNGGFVLLGKVIEAASGEDYYAYVRQHIYSPAGMTRTEHWAIDEAVGDRATGYTSDPEVREGVGADTLPGRVANTAGAVGRGSSAGGGYSTVGDMVRFARALRAGKLLDPEHRQEVFGEHFSLGIGGGSPGVNALFQVAGPYTFVVLSNLDPPAAEVFAPTVGRMLRRAAGLPPPRVLGGPPPTAQ